MIGNERITWSSPRMLRKERQYMRSDNLRHIVVGSSPEKIATV
jgi:hypothetical protein